MRRPCSAFAVSWSPLLLLLLLPAVQMTPVVIPDKPHTPETVSLLMEKSTVKFDLFKYFTELQLQNGCTSPLVNDHDFPKALTLHYESSICTIIYNMTKELEVKSMDMPDNLAKTVHLEKSDKSADKYTVWKNVSKISKSPSLILLMEHLNETNKWNSVCYNFNGNLFPYCEFLHSEILLLQNISQIVKECKHS